MALCHWNVKFKFLDKNWGCRFSYLNSVYIITKCSFKSNLMKNKLGLTTKLCSEHHWQWLSSQTVPKTCLCCEWQLLHLFNPSGVVCDEFKALNVRFFTQGSYAFSSWSHCPQSPGWYSPDIVGGERTERGWCWPGWPGQRTPRQDRLSLSGRGGNSIIATI